jgi:integrase/recombinase XerD
MKWQANLINHRGQKRIAVYFERNTNAIARFKKRWSVTLKVWHLPDTPTSRKQFGLEPMEDKVLSFKIHPVNPKRVRALYRNPATKGLQPQHSKNLPQRVCTVCCLP